MKRRKRILLEVLVIYLISLMLVSSFKGPGVTELVKTVLSVSTFLFAIILAFSTANRHKRLNGIRHALRSDDAALLNLYRSCALFGKKELNKFRKLLDNYLTAQIDFYLEDYQKTTPFFLNIFDYVVNLNPKNEKQRSAKSQMFTDIRDSMKNQKEVLYWVKDKMVPVEWYSLIILCGSILICLMHLNDQSNIAILLIPFIATALILLLLVLRELNNLQWQEQDWIWKPLEELFLELDLKPYYTEILFDSKRIKESQLQDLKSYRVAHYKNPYPDMKGKSVKIVKNR